jgi:hypothetical protein
MVHKQDLSCMCLFGGSLRGEDQECPPFLHMTLFPFWEHIWWRLFSLPALRYTTLSSRHVWNPDVSQFSCLWPAARRPMPIIEIFALSAFSVRSCDSTASGSGRIGSRRPRTRNFRIFRAIWAQKSDRHRHLYQKCSAHDPLSPVTWIFGQNSTLHCGIYARIFLRPSIRAHINETSSASATSLPLGSLSTL